jgi:hypothetical protein
MSVKIARILGITGGIFGAFVPSFMFYIIVTSIWQGGFIAGYAISGISDNFDPLL